MTSKEAIKRIKKVGDYIAQSNAWDIRDELYKCCDTIEKDLKVLEILKPKLMVEKGSTWEYLEIKHPFFDTQDEIDKVKEWLKND